MKKHLLTALLLSTALLAQSAKQDDINEVTAIGKQASAALLKTLGGHLKKHLKAGGPMDAFDFCSNNAYALTQEVDKAFGKNVSVKRVSLKYRNPANKPLADEEPVLQALHLMKKSGVALPKELVQNEGNGVYKYYKPLLINKQACLHCHGDVAKNQALHGAIKKVYPSDRATGFKMHDLRGAIVVEVHK